MRHARVTCTTTINNGLIHKTAQDLTSWQWHLSPHWWYRDSVHGGVPRALTVWQAWEFKEHFVEWWNVNKHNHQQPLFFVSRPYSVQRYTYSWWHYNCYSLVPPTAPRPVLRMALRAESGRSQNARVTLSLTIGPDFFELNDFPRFGSEKSGVIFEVEIKGEMGRYRSISFAIGLCKVAHLKWAMVPKNWPEFLAAFFT